MSIETARKLTVRVTVEIDLYVAPDEGWGEEDYAEAIRRDLLDTLAYKTGNATDSEQGEVVCTAPPRGRSPEAAVTISDLEVLATEEAEIGEVRDEAESVASERP